MSYNGHNEQLPNGGPAVADGHRPTARGGFISRGINAVVGLAAESIASRKDNKAAPTTYNEQLGAPPSYEQSRAEEPGSYQKQSESGYSPREKGVTDADESDGADSDYDKDDEDELNLDEMAQELRGGDTEALAKPPTGKLLSPATIKTLAESFVERFPPPPKPIGTLERPVILPQRRPGNKRRGFVQAYAPMLQQTGIDQDAFLSFCDYFEQAIKVSPIFDIINLASNVVGMNPTISAQIVSTVATIVDLTAQEMYARNRTNDFLGRMNETYFKPHGLFCMIVIYKPEEPQTFNETIDIVTGTVSDRGVPIPEQTRTGKFRLASAETKGETEMPEPAPLIFPQLDKWAKEGGPGYKPETAGFLRDYFDRRAQANFVHQNPNAVIAAEPNFASRFADPTYQAQFGGRPSRMLIGALSGGEPGQRTTRRGERRNEKVERRQAKRARRGPGLIGGIVDGAQQLATGRKPDSSQAGRGPIGRVLQVMREDVLYMIVAPLASKERRAQIQEAFSKIGM